MTCTTSPPGRPPGTRPGADVAAAGAAVTASDVILGAGLIFVLAAGSQVLASRLRLPAIIILLPVGFAAGALTDNVKPDRLLGHAFAPVVGLAVAVILYDAGLSVRLRDLTDHTRQIVLRLLAIGVPVTLVVGAAATAMLGGMSHDVAVVIGAVLVLTGSAVVAPLMSFVRPAERLRHVLSWEATLIDPVGGVLGVLVFYAVLASHADGFGEQVGQFFLSTAVGLGGGIVGAVVLWAALRKLRLARSLVATVQLAVVVGVAAGCDALRDDTGLLAAIIMGLALANLRGFRVPARRLLETLVEPLVGLLLLAISTLVTPDSLRPLVLPTLGIVAVLVLVARPLVTLAATRRTALTRRERIFVGWLAPRGVVAAALAAAFVGPLGARGIPGATLIRPVVFLVIVVTIALYGLTAVPLSQWLGVLRSPRSRPLLVGGEDWVIDLGETLQTAGLDVLMWAGLEPQRERIRQATLQLAPDNLLASVTAERAELAGITTVLLLTAEDDFNALAAAVLRYAVGDSVFRVGPPAGGLGVVAPFTGGKVLFGHALNRSTLASRYLEGARIVGLQAGCDLPAGHELLFIVRADGTLEPATRQRAPVPGDGDTLVLLSTTTESY
jgi:NhaP-type Na+/H+ or K+/H+ antiporter